MARRPAYHTPVTSRRAPRPLGHAAQAVLAAPGAQLFVGAQLPLEMPSGRPAQGPTRQQAGLVLAHLKAVVEEAGFHLDQVVAVSVWLVDLAQLDAFDAVYRTYFLGGSPARSVVGVSALPQGAALAVACQAVRAAAAAPPAEAPYEDDYIDD